MTPLLQKSHSDKGPFKKCVMPEGGEEGVRCGVTKCDRGRGRFAMRDVAPVKFYNDVKFS